MTNLRSFSSKVRQTLLWLGVTALILTGCGGGGGAGTADTGSDPAPETGDLLLGLTDAEGDFLTYAVDVTSIKLTRQNGAIVEALPLTTTVDFAQYVEVSELLTVATIPVGVYTAVELNLDYSNAAVTVQSDSGDPIEATLVDGEGQALTQLAINLELDEGSRFRIARGVPAQVTLDFDLDASNQVEVSGNSATVTVEPVLLADTIRENPKPFRLRGLLGEVAQDQQVFSIDLLPFRHRNGLFGSARVHINEQTKFEIDGVAYDSEAGLTELAAKTGEVPVVTLGQWTGEIGGDKQYTATEVYAGTSVPWHDADVVKGVVIARSDNTLTVHGALKEFSDGRHDFSDNLVVELGPNTKVTKQLSGASSLADISIGSAILVSGEFSDDTTLDASEGHVRIRLSNLVGSVVSVSPLAVDVSRLSGRRPGNFDFSGTGADAETDADPDHYEVDTGSLTLPDMGMGEPVRIRGFVQEFGAAPEDFISRTAIDASEVKGHLLITYGREGADTSKVRLGDEGITFDLEGSGRHHIIRAGIPVDMTTLSSAPVIVPGGDQGVFALTRRGRAEIFRDFVEFVSALEEALAAGSKVTRVDAHGNFNSNLLEFSTTRMRVGLVDAQ